MIPRCMGGEKSAPKTSKLRRCFASALCSLLSDPVGGQLPSNTLPLSLSLWLDHQNDARVRSSHLFPLLGRQWHACLLTYPGYPRERLRGVVSVRYPYIHTSSAVPWPLHFFFSSDALCRLEEHLLYPPMPLKTLQHDARHLCYLFIPEPAALRDRNISAHSSTVRG